MAQALGLKDRHEAAGATWVERWGWEVVVRYAGRSGLPTATPSGGVCGREPAAAGGGPDRGRETPPTREYDALRSRVGIADLSWRGRLCVGGKDRVEVLHGLLTHDIKSLRPGGGCRAVAATMKGRVLADLRVYVDADAAWIDLPPGRAGPIAQHLLRHVVTEDVTIRDAGDAFGVIGLLGPAAPALLAAMAGREAPRYPAYGHGAWTLANAPVRLVASRWGAVEGYEVWSPADALGAVWDLAVEKGGACGAAPVGLEALNGVRIEGGVGWYGEDFDESNFPQEAGLDDAISYTKGCYLGQEPIARIHYQGHVNRRLVGVALEGGEAPPAKAEVTAGGKAVGHVTSAAWSPALGKPIALAMLAREAAAGTAVAVKGAGGPQPGRVVELPLSGV